MSRRRGSYRREIDPDPVYKDVTVSRFINKLMWSGNKSVAQGIVYQAIEGLKGGSSSEDPLTVFKKALENVKPSLEVRSRRVGGATYQIPVDVRPTRKLALAMRWVIEYARERNEKDMALRLTGELMDAYNNRGNAIKKKDDVHRMAEANKAFSHYNW